MPGAEDALRVINEFVVKHGYPPTVRELAAALGFQSPSTAFRLLLQLREEGKVDWNPRHGRTLRVIPDGVHE